MSGSGRTLKDLAGRLGISVATASRALAGHERISLKTRERVVAAAREIGYAPNRAARALVSGRTGFVGLVLPIRGPGHKDPFLGELVTGLGEGLAGHGIDLFLAMLPSGQSELSVVEHLVRDRRADALVLARVSEEDPRINFLLEQGFPFVAHGRLLEPAMPYCWVDTDGRAAFAEAFELLYGLGHRHFGLVTISEPMTFRRLRGQGLEEAVASRGDPSVRLDVAMSPRFDRALREKEIRNLLTRPDRPTAVIALFDGLAVAVLEEAARLGLRVPRDLSVIGFDNVPIAEHVPPGLTTFEASIHACAVEIAGMVVRRLSKPDSAPETHLVRPTLVARGSHGPVPTL